MGALTAEGIQFEDGLVWTKISDEDGFSGDHAEARHINCKRTIKVGMGNDIADTETVDESAESSAFALGTAFAAVVVGAATLF